MEKQMIRSLRKGSVQWNEEDRIQLVALLAKCGYAVRIGRRVIPGQTRRTLRWNTPWSFGRKNNV